MSTMGGCASGSGAFAVAAVVGLVECCDPVQDED